MDALVVGLAPKKGASKKTKQKIAVYSKQRRIERIVKDDESSIRSDTRDLPGCPPDMSGPTGYTGDSLASDL